MEICITSCKCTWLNLGRNFDLFCFKHEKILSHVAVYDTKHSCQISC
jgi:hypothetical protein